jgi:hypothetical protein
MNEETNEIKKLKMKILQLESQNGFLEADRDRLASQCHVSSRKVANKNEIIESLQKQIVEKDERNNSNIDILKKEIKCWENKWKAAIEMAAIVENKLADIKKCL